jgi:hyperosmotically inducible protein
MLPYYGVFDDLAFQVRGDTVTLMGEVTWPTLKSDAERAVKKVEGVDKVVNRIEVLPLSPMDDRIRMAVPRALYSGNSPLMRYGMGAVSPIHIIVENGRVTLTGVVDRESDKSIAGLLANRIPGIFAVRNNLAVKQG